MEQSDSLFFYLAVVLGLSSIFGFLAKSFRLPLLVAYLVTGVSLSVLGVFNPATNEILRVFPEMGIALVLFLVGMELDVQELRFLGKPIIIGSLAQVVISGLAGFGLASLFGFSTTEASFLGVGLSVSSTIVVVKLLLDKKDLNSLYGKLSVGILLVEDIIAVVVLMSLTVGNSLLDFGLQSGLPFVAFLVKAAVLLLLTFVVARPLLKRLFGAVASSTELLFLSALGWCFLFIAAGVLLGFSVVVGAFLAGVALANSPFHYEIQGKVRPLRDFFVALFFVYLGLQVTFNDVGRVIPIVVIFTLFALIVKPLIFMLILGFFGFKKHTLFQMGLNLSQVSEFSLIIMLVGISLGLVTSTPLTIIALTGVLSIILSSLMITASRLMYQRFGFIARLFEHKSVFRIGVENEQSAALDGHVVLVGAHRFGSSLVGFFEKMKIPLLIIDFNPKVIQALAQKGFHALYGDIGDPEMFDFLNVQKAKLIISTAQDRDDNLFLLSQLKRRRTAAPVILRAATIADAQTLYGSGADYVILPEIVAGDFLREALKRYWPNVDFFKDKALVELPKLKRHTLALE